VKRNRLTKRRPWRRALVLLCILAALPLTIGATSQSRGAAAQTFATSETDGTNSFLSATCSQNAANAIFTSGTFTASGQFADSGIVQTTLLTGAAIDGVAPNQVGGTISYLGARANAFIDFTGQLKCDSATSGRVTSVVGTLRYYVTTSHGASAYKLSASPRDSSFTLNFANASMASTIAGSASVGD
jgi:hypothetical protein